jgi:hypothetical protein
MKVFPSKSFYVIELDTRRMSMLNDEQKDVFRWILNNYIKRNPIQGSYHQAQSFILAFIILKIYKYKSDIDYDSNKSKIKYIRENAFWHYAMLIESKLPLNFYSNNMLEINYVLNHLFNWVFKQIDPEGHKALSSSLSMILIRNF